MNSRSLEYVVAVYETHSLRAAAERCHATAGTISAQITRLESYLGVRIFERRGEPATLTVQGRVLIHEFEQAVAHLRRARQYAREESSLRRV